MSKECKECQKMTKFMSNVYENAVNTKKCQEM